MLKRFCDLCGVAMQDATHPLPNIGGTYTKSGHDIHVSITVETQPKGEIDVCRHCVLDAVASLDERPKAAQPWLTPDSQRRC